MVRINLLPIREILRKRELKQFIILACAIVASTIGIMGLTFLYFTWVKDGLVAQKKSQEAKLHKLREDNKAIEALKKEVARLQTQVDNIQKLTKVRITPAPFMAALSLAIPEEVWIDSIQKSGPGFSLDGTGIDSTVVVNFVERLQRVRKDFTETDPWLHAVPNKVAAKPAENQAPPPPAAKKKQPEPPAKGAPQPPAAKPAPQKAAQKPPTEQSFFANVKLVQIVAAPTKGGLSTMKFKITGSVR